MFDLGNRPGGPNLSVTTKTVRKAPHGWLRIRRRVSLMAG